MSNVEKIIYWNIDFTTEFTTFDGKTILKYAKLYALKENDEMG